MKKKRKKMRKNVCMHVGGGEQRVRSKRGSRVPVPHKEKKVMAMEREYYIRLSGVVVAFLS